MHTALNTLRHMEQRRCLPQVKMAGCQRCGTVHLCEKINKIHHKQKTKSQWLNDNDHIIHSCDWSHRMNSVIIWVVIYFYTHKQSSSLLRVCIFRQGEHSVASDKYCIKKNPQARYESVCKNSICVEQWGFVNGEERHSLDGRKDGVILCQKHKRILFEAKEFHLLWRRGAGTERALHVNRKLSKCKITSTVHQGALKSTLHIRLE